MDGRQRDHVVPLRKQGRLRNPEILAVPPIPYFEKRAHRVVPIAAQQPKEPIDIRQLGSRLIQQLDVRPISRAIKCFLQQLIHGDSRPETDEAVDGFDADA